VISKKALEGGVCVSQTPLARHGMRIIVTILELMAYPVFGFASLFAGVLAVPPLVGEEQKSGMGLKAELIILSVPWFFIVILGFWLGSMGVFMFVDAEVGGCS
jgi:hypothetical protein